MKSLIVDHDAFARQELTTLLQQRQDVSQILEASDSVQAMDVLSREGIHLMFLDPKLPLIDGYEFLARSPVHPPVIMTSAHEADCYPALMAGAIDFLKKPYQNQHVQACFERLRLKASQLATLKGECKPTLNKVLCRTHNTHHVVWVEDIHHISKAGRYTKIQTNRGLEFLTNDPLTYFQTHLPSQSFYQINRGLILARSAIKGFMTTPSGCGKLACHDGSQFMVSRNRLAPFRNWLHHA